MVEYFCYISRDKVDQLLEVHGPVAPDTWREQTSAMTERRAGGAISNVMSILSGDVSYGRTDVVQRNVAVKRTYARKLKQLLSVVANNISPFEYSINVARTGVPLYHYAARFIVTAIDDVHLIATLMPSNDDERLSLHCSLANFSVTAVKNGKPFLTSTNYAFFKGRLPVYFDTVFLLTSVHRGAFIGSPLYLRLAAQDGLLV